MTRAGQKAIFLDRDGVINYHVYYPDTDECESPRHVSDFCLINGALAALQLLINSGYSLFIVSNQPSYAKGKTSLKNLQGIHQKMENILKQHQIFLSDSFYCYHHPKGIVPKYSFPCQCHKPSPCFLLQAAKKYHLNLKNAWMAGDRDIDLQCGQGAGVKVIGIYNQDIESRKATSIYQNWHENLLSVVQLIIKE